MRKGGVAKAVGTPRGTEADRQLAGRVLRWRWRVPQRPMGRAAEPGAGLQGVVDSFLKGGAEFGHGFAVEADQVADADEAAVLVAVFDAGGVALTGHGLHGFTPACSRNARASRTW